MFTEQLFLAGKQEWMQRELRFEFTLFFHVLAGKLRSKLSYCAATEGRALLTQQSLLIRNWKILVQN